MIKKAIGGILFVDEAYSLGRGGEKDFGKEAIDTLVKHMEDRQHEFVLILAGYSREMDRFLSFESGTGIALSNHHRISGLLRRTTDENC